MAGRPKGAKNNGIGKATLEMLRPQLTELIVDTLKNGSRSEKLEVLRIVAPYAFQKLPQEITGKDGGELNFSIKIGE